MKFKLLINSEIVRTKRILMLKAAESMKIALLINVKMPTCLLALLTFMSRLNFMLNGVDL